MQCDMCLSWKVILWQILPCLAASRLALELETSVHNRTWWQAARTVNGSRPQMDRHTSPRRWHRPKFATTAATGVALIDLT